MSGHKHYDVALILCSYVCFQRRSIPSDLQHLPTAVEMQTLHRTRQTLSQEADTHTQTHTCVWGQRRKFMIFCSNFRLLKTSNESGERLLCCLQGCVLIICRYSRIRGSSCTWMTYWCLHTLTVLLFFITCVFNDHTLIAEIGKHPGQCWQSVTEETYDYLYIWWRAQNSFCLR